MPTGRFPPATPSHHKKREAAPYASPLVVTMWAQSLANTRPAGDLISLSCHNVMMTLIFIEHLLK